MHVNIKVRRKGVNFACDAIVSLRGKRLHTTREYPHGFDAAAYSAAKRWALDSGYNVREG